MRKLVSDQEQSQSTIASIARSQQGMLQMMNMLQHGMAQLRDDFTRQLPSMAWDIVKQLVQQGLLPDNINRQEKVVLPVLGLSQQGLNSAQIETSPPIRNDGTNQAL